MPPKGYANLSIREDVRKMLDELRAETGIYDLSDLLVVLVRTYRDYTNAISKIQELLTSSTSKVVTSTGNVSRNPTTSSISEGYEWCRSKAKVRNLQSFLDWVDKTFGLIDWWEEEGRVCFETRKKPAKTD